jgi:hypothetical protein
MGGQWSQEDMFRAATGGAGGHDYSRAAGDTSTAVDVAKVDEMLAVRISAKKGGDFVTADRIRDELRAMRVQVSDPDRTWRVMGTPGAGQGGRSEWQSERASVQGAVQAAIAAALGGGAAAPAPAPAGRATAHKMRVGGAAPRCAPAESVGLCGRRLSVASRWPARRS